MAKAIRTKPALTEMTIGTETETGTLEAPQQPETIQSPINSQFEEAVENKVSASELLKRTTLHQQSAVSQRQADFVDDVIEKLNAGVEEPKKSYKLHVTLRKIQHKNFRLGMELTEEKFQLVPGTGQTFVPFMKGGKYLTGLEDKPDTRARLEKELGVDLSPSSEFYENVRYRMEDRTNGQLLVIEEGYHGGLTELIYYTMIASPIIANGLHEYTSGEKPEAQWYIENKEAEAEAEQKVISTEMEAFNMFNEMSPVRRTQLAKIIGLRPWGLSESVVKTALWKYLKTPKSNSQGPSTIAQFLTEAKKSDSTIAVKALVQDAIHYNILRVNSARDFIYGDENMGGTVEAVETKLLSPRSIQLRAGIEEKINLAS